MKKNNILNSINDGVKSLNSSRFFSGLMMVMLNVGSKYVTIQLSESQKNVLNKYAIFRQLLIFAVFWMGTKDLYTSLAMTAVFIILTQHIFNEKSKFCVLPKRWTEVHSAIDTNSDGELSEEEIDNAIQVLQKTKNQQQNLKKNININNLQREFMRNRL